MFFRFSMLPTRAVLAYSSCSVRWLLKVGSRYLWNSLAVNSFMSWCCYGQLMAVDSVGVELQKLLDGVGSASPMANLSCKTFEDRHAHFGWYVHVFVFRSDLSKWFFPRAPAKGSS